MREAISVHFILPCHRASLPARVLLHPVARPALRRISIWTALRSRGRRKNEEETMARVAAGALVLVLTRALFNSLACSSLQLCVIRRRCESSTFLWSPRACAADASTTAACCP